MAANNNPVFEKEPYSKAASWTNSDAALTKKDVVPAADVPTEGLRVDQLSLTSIDTAARVFRFYDHDGTTSFLIGAVNVPALSGSDGVAPPVDAIPTLAAAVGYINLPSGHKLQGENVTQVTAAKQVDVMARGGKLTA